jgi:hypothetical protein
MSENLVRVARRYGPIAAVAALLLAAFVLFGGDGSGDDDDDAGGEDASATDSFDYEELVRSGPMTPQKAELLGEQADFGANCDPDTGRIELPTVYAPPCVEPFEGDNGGTTSTGVTEDAIEIVIFASDPEVDPLGAALIEAAGADLDPAAITETMQGYADIFNDVFEMYGRRVELEFYTGTGANDDQEAARADAIAIAEMEPFAVVGGPLQASAPFADELAEHGIISLPPQPLPESFLRERFPLVWPVTTPNQAVRLAAEAIGHLAGPGKAEMAGDPALQEQDRTYAVVHYDTTDGDHQEVFEDLRDGLAEQGIDLATDVKYIVDLARVQDTARTIVAQLEEADVTTVIFYGDFLTPASLTQEATAQDYFPEWILGPNYLADTALYARTYDQQQWSHGFAMAFSSGAGALETSTSYLIYTWAYGEDPPSNIFTALEPPLRRLFGGLQLAGPELTPESFRDGLFRVPPAGGGPTRPMESRGSHGLWPELDLGTFDDVALTWWDPSAVAEGFEGTGMYRFANGGQRYALGQLPDSPEEAGLFDRDASVVEYQELPAEDEAPTYPPPG